MNDTPEASEPSLRDTLSNAFEEADKAEVTLGKITQEVEKIETKVESPAETEEKAARARDASGKFAKKVEPSDVVIGPPHVDAPKPATAPQSWSAAAKAKWNELPPEFQQEMLKREDDVHKGFTKLDDERNFGRQLKDVITPYMPQIIAEGGTPAGAVKDLLNTAYILRTASPQQKGQLIMRIAQQYGADLSQVSEQAYVDPTIQQLQNEIAQLKGQFSGAEVSKQQQEQAALNQNIAAFAADPKNVHFETVKADMAALLQGGRAKDLQDAYDMSVWARPDIRSTLIQQQSAEMEAKRNADIKSKADAARMAGGSVKGGPGVAIPNTGSPNRSLREELEAQFRAQTIN